MTLDLGILLALACAFVANLGFFYKYRGANAVPKVEVLPPAALGAGAVLLQVVHARHDHGDRQLGRCTWPRSRSRRCRWSRSRSPPASCSSP